MSCGDWRLEVTPPEVIEMLKRMAKAGDEHAIRVLKQHGLLHEERVIKIH